MSVPAQEMDNVPTGLIALAWLKSSDILLLSRFCLALVQATFKPQSPDSFVDLGAFVIGADIDHGR